jgi:glycosyltransferase involved in cell wall biosynthesis
MRLAATRRVVDVGAPRILYVTPWHSGTPKSASELRSDRIANVLQQLGKVEVVSVRDHHDNADPAIEDSAPASDDGLCVGVHPLRHRGWKRKAHWLLDPRVAQPHGVAVDASAADVVRAAARDSDVIWFFKLRTANMFPDWSWPRSVVDVDDLPSQFERSMLSSIPAHQRIATRLRAWSWQRRERLLAERFSVLTVCSEADRGYLAGLGVDAPVHVVPNGFDRPAVLPTRRLASPPRLGFIGVFDHAPNAAGVHWFTQHCWPLIKRRVPAARLRLVGRLTDGPMRPPGPDIDALGYIPEANEEMATWSAMVVPVRSGAGTRGKIAHALSQKCPVVSTRLGAYGYEPAHGRDMLLGDSAEEFADACVLAIQQPQVGAEIARRAWDRFVETWTWEAIGPQVLAAAQDCLARGGRAVQQTRYVPREPLTAESS